MNLTRFAEAEAALAAGRRDEGIALVVQQLELDSDAPLQFYRNFTALLIRNKRYAEAERWARRAVELHPKDFDLWNNLGVSLRRLKRHEDALEAIGRAIKLNPKSTAPLINRGNILNDIKDGPASIALWTKLVRAQPTNPEHQRALGRGYWYSGDLDKAMMRFRLATKLRPDYVDAWLDLIAIVAEDADLAGNLAGFEQALAVIPDAPKLHESKAIMLRRFGRHKDAEAALLEVADKFKDHAWLHYQLAIAISEWDRIRAHAYMEKALELEPDNVEYRMGFAESLGRTRIDESAMLERAYGVLQPVLDKVEDNSTYMKIASELLTRLADYDGNDALADFKTMGRSFAEGGKHTALLTHLARVRTPEDRVELMEQHRIWGDEVVKILSAKPITKRGPRTPNGKIRIGFMSSDLRAHPVAYFALPLFQHYDKSRFEIYCYSFYLHEEDFLQARIREMVDVFRWEKESTDRQIAQTIADDQLDILIELGASTHMNRVGVMAYKAAPLQASWLGYPHSVGLPTIDHFILDPYVLPPRRELVMEEPLLMPKSWIAMGEMAFPDRDITAGTPESRNGFLTFGTANNPYKYSKSMVKTWARVTASVPNARFMLVRPEGGAPTFRRHIEALFASEGVSADRLKFQDIRGAHMPFYNDIDISLDTFPQTGGTTTCESLFMGVPVITMVGDGVFERLSYSILTNAGLGDLCATNEDEYLRIAQQLAGDAPRREKLRTELRGMLKASPLGQTKQFAADFFNMIEGAVKRAQAKVGEPA